MMGINLRVPIGKNSTVGERAVPNLDGKAGTTRVGIKINTAGTTRVGIKINTGMTKVGTGTTRIEIGPTLRKEVNLTIRIGNTTLTVEMTTPEAEA